MDTRAAEFEKRMALPQLWSLTVHDKAAGDAPFLEGLALIEREAGDPRNFVEKAVNMALPHRGRLPGNERHERRRGAERCRKLPRLAGFVGKCRPCSKRLAFRKRVAGHRRRACHAVAAAATPTTAAPDERSADGGESVLEELSTLHRGVWWPWCCL